MTDPSQISQPARYKKWNFTECAIISQLENSVELLRLVPKQEKSLHGGKYKKNKNPSYTHMKIYLYRSGNNLRRGQNHKNVPSME
jgi:hypothetical protein